jgi:hypothetical protein
MPYCNVAAQLKEAHVIILSSLVPIPGCTSTHYLANTSGPFVAFLGKSLLSIPNLAFHGYSFHPLFPAKHPTHFQQHHHLSYQILN